MCTREGGGCETSSSSRLERILGVVPQLLVWQMWKRHLVQVTALLPSPRLVLRLPQVAPFHPRLFCIETHFPVFLLLLLRSCARSCQPGWWRPTVKGSGWSGGTQVSLVPVECHQSHLIYAGRPQQRRCVAPPLLVASPRTLSRDFRLLRRSDTFQVGTLAD